MFGMRMVRLAAAGLLAAEALASGTADAFAGTTRDERNLAPPATSTTGAAEGVVEAKETTKKRTLRVEVKNLAPKRRYEVRRGGESGEVLDTFKTNRKGKGTGKVKEDAPAPAEEAPRDERNVSRSHLAWNPFAGNGGVGALDGGTGDDPRDDSGNPGYGYGYGYGYGNYYDYELPDWDDFFPPGGYDYYFPPFPGDDYYYIP